MQPKNKYIHKLTLIQEATLQLNITYIYNIYLSTKGRNCKHCVKYSLQIHFNQSNDTSNIYYLIILLVLMWLKISRKWSVQYRLSAYHYW